MRYDLGRFRRPMRRSTEGQLMSLTSLGDGSTLTLDFTTGVLDPRLTFDRTSTATCINSSGLVQFANANLMTYSTPRASGSAWLTTGTVTWGSATIANPNGAATAQEVTFGTTGSAIFNSAGTTVTSGITHTFSVWLRAATGTTNVRLGSANAVGSPVTLTTTWQRFSIQYTTVNATDGGAVYSQTGTPSATFYVWGAQLQPGSTVGELLETTGTLRRNIPRFDHDPTTLAPRGLLIEGQAVNTLLNSASAFTSTGWFTSGTGTKTITVNHATAPDGTTTAARLQLGQNCALKQNAGATGVNHAVSIWVKSNTGSNQTIAFWTGTAAANRTATTSWTRIEAVVNNTAASLFDLYNPNATDCDILIWGAQLETGSGASSYIPTGASQVTRTQELLSMTGTGLSWFSNSYSEGTFLFRGSIINTATGYTRIFALTQSASLANATGASPNFNAGVAASASNRPFLNAWVTANNDVDIYVPVGAAVTNGVEFAFAAAYKASDWRISSKNLAATSTFASVGTTWGTNFFMSGINGVFMPAVWYKQFKFFPVRLSNAQMDALSA